MVAKKIFGLAVALGGLSACGGAQGLVEAMAKDRATACIAVQSPWGSASAARSNPELPADANGSAEITVSAGTCTIKLGGAAQ